MILTWLPDTPRYKWWDSVHIGLYPSSSGESPSWAESLRLCRGWPARLRPKTQAQWTRDRDWSAAMAGRTGRGEIPAIRRGWAPANRPESWWTMVKKEESWRGIGFWNDAVTVNGGGGEPLSEIERGSEKWRRVCLWVVFLFFVFPGKTFKNPQVPNQDPKNAKRQKNPSLWGRNVSRFFLLLLSVSVPCLLSLSQRHATHVCRKPTRRIAIARARGTNMRQCSARHRNRTHHWQKNKTRRRRFACLKPSSSSSSPMSSFLSHWGFLSICQWMFISSLFTADLVMWLSHYLSYQTMFWQEYIPFRTYHQFMIINRSCI